MRYQENSGNYFLPCLPAIQKIHRFKAQEKGILFKTGNKELIKQEMVS